MNSSELDEQNMDFNMKLSNKQNNIYNEYKKFVQNIPKNKQYYDTRQVFHWYLDESRNGNFINQELEDSERKKYIKDNILKVRSGEKIVGEHELNS